MVDRLFVPLTDVPCIILPRPCPPLRSVRVADAPEPASAVRDDDGGWTLTYRPDATVEQIQAAVDAVGMPVIIGCETMYEETGRKLPGPPPRQETKRERSRRWRRAQR